MKLGLIGVALGLLALSSPEGHAQTVTYIPSVGTTTYSTSGTTTNYGTPATIQTVQNNTVLVPSGATVLYTAFASITLMPGFHAATGSHFTALIGTVPIQSFTPNLISFTYNGSSQGPTITTIPAGATYSPSTIPTQINPSTYSTTLTGSNGYSGSTVISWTIQQFVSISPASTTVAFNGHQSFTAQGGEVGGTYVWSVSPSGPSGILSNGAASQTLTFTSEAVSGSPPRPSPFTISAYCQAGPGYPQSNAATASASVTGVPVTQDSNNTTVQLNVHAPTQ